MARNTQGIAGAQFANLVTNASDNLPIVYSQDIQGGLTSVADSAARLLIPAQKLQEGMLVYEDGSNSYFMFLATTVNTTSGNREPLARNSDGNFTNSNAVTRTPPAQSDVTNADSWQEIQFDVDSITVSSADVDPVPRSTQAIDNDNPANPVNPHEGDLYINHGASQRTLWYYVGGSVNEWVSSEGITTGVGDGRYVSFVADQSSMDAAAVDRARRNLDINLTERDSVTSITGVIPGTNVTDWVYSSNQLRMSIAPGTNNVVGREFDVGEEVFVTLTAGGFTDATAYDNRRFIGTVLYSEAVGNNWHVNLDITEAASRTYLDGVADQFDDISTTTINTWSWWKRDNGYEGVIVADNSGNIINQSIEVFEDRVRPTFVEWDQATTTGDFATAPTRTLSHIGFQEAFNGPYGINFQDDEGNNVVFDGTNNTVLSLTTAGAVDLNTNVATTDNTDAARQAEVRRAIGAGTGDADVEDIALTVSSGTVGLNTSITATGTTPEEMLASRQAAVRSALDVHNTARIVGERYALSNGNVEEWEERRTEGGASVVNRYRAAVDRVETSTLVTSSTATLGATDVRITVDAGYQTAFPTTGRITLQYPRVQDPDDATVFFTHPFISAVIAEGRNLAADNTNGRGVRIYGHTVGFPVGAVFEVALATGETGTPGTSNVLVANLLCEINDARRVTRRDTTQTFTYEVLADSGTGVSFDVLNSEGNEESPTSIISVVRGSDTLNFTTVPGDPDRVTVTDAVTDGDMLVVTYAVNEFSGFTPSNPAAINGQQALYAILDEVSEVLVPSITAFELAKYYDTNELVTDGGIIYRKLTTNFPNTARPGNDAGNWQQESLITADIPYDPQTFTNSVNITGTVDTNTFTFTGYADRTAAQAARLSLLENIFGLTRAAAQVAIPSSAPVSFPATIPIVSVNSTPSTALRLTGLMVSSILPTGTTFAITIHGLVGGQTADSPITPNPSTGRTVTFTRANDEVSVHEITTVTDGGIRLTAGGNILTLSADDTIVRQDELPNLENSTSSTISNLSSNPNFTPQFEVTANSIGQTEFQKQGNAAVGSFMAVGADGQSVSYVPSDSTRPSRWETPSSEDLDIAVQRRYTRASWDANHPQFASVDTNSGTGNTAAFPLRMPTSNVLSVEMINELNALTQASDNTALEYAAGETYGINPFERSTAVAGRPEIIAQNFVEAGVDSLAGFEIDVDLALEFALRGNQTDTNLTILRIPGVRADVETGPTTVFFDEYIRRANDLLRNGTSPLRDQWSISTDYVTGSRSANIIFTASNNGSYPGDITQSAVNFVASPGQTLHTEIPRRVGDMHVVQSGVATSGATNVPHTWTELTETTQTFTGTNDRSTYEVSGDIVNQSFVIVELDDTRQALGTDYTVNVAANTITFIDNAGDPRNIANGVTITVIYSTAVDLAQGQYLLFRVTGIVGGSSTGRIANATWLNDGIGTGNFTKVAATAFTRREFTDESVTEANRLASNINTVSNTDTGILTLPTVTPVPQADIDAFVEAEHDRYVLIQGTHETASGIYIHILDIASDGTHIEVDMDHYLSVNADNTVTYRPNVTFNVEIGNDYTMYVLNFAGAGDVTKEGNSPQTINRVTNFTVDPTTNESVLRIGNRGLRYLNPETNASLAHPTPGITAFDVGGTATTPPSRIRLDAYTRDEADDENQRAIARIHSEGITHDVAPGLSLVGDNLGIGIRPAGGNHTFRLNRGFSTPFSPRPAEPPFEDFDIITNLDNDILDSVEGAGATQPFVRVAVPNHTQVTNFQFTQTFTVTQAQVDASTFTFTIATDDTRPVNSVVSITRNGTPLLASEYTENLPSITVITALDLNDTIAITYRNGAILNVGDLTDRTLSVAVLQPNGTRVRGPSLISTVANRPTTADPTVMEGVITLAANRDNVGTYAAFGTGSIIALNTNGITFDGSTSLELTVVSAPTTTLTEIIVREFSAAEIARFNNPAAGVIWRDFEAPALTGTFSDTTVPLENVSVSQGPAGTMRLNADQIFQEDTDYVFEFLANSGQYYHGIMNRGTAGGIFIFGGTNIFLRPQDANIRWFPSRPNFNSTTGDFSGTSANQQVFIYEAAESTDRTELFYHFTPRDGDSNRLREDWGSGNYEVTLANAYATNNRVLTPSQLPVVRHAFPIEGQFELGYFSNRLTLAGLERFEPVRDPTSGAYTLNFNNNSMGSPTSFYRGFYRTDLAIPVYMIRQVIPEFRETPDDDPVVQTTWAPWDGNPPNTTAMSLDPRSDFPADASAGDLFILSDPVIQGSITRPAGLYQRNQRNNGWTELPFGNTLPSTTFTNE